MPTYAFVTTQKVFLFIVQCSCSLPHSSVDCSMFCSNPLFLAPCSCCMSHSSVPCFVTVFVFSVNVVFFMCQAETRFWYFLSPPLPYGYSHSTPVENLGCWPPCLITSTGVKIPSTRTTVGTDSLPLPSLELAPHQRPWQNTTATCASRACLVPSTDKCGEVYQVH